MLFQKNNQKKNQNNTLQRHCQWCGSITVDLQAITIYVCREDKWTSLAFRCPKCRQQLFVPATAASNPVDVVTDFALIERLVDADCSMFHWSVQDGYPVDLGEPKHYKPTNWAKNRHLGEVGFDLVDCVSLVNAMETVDWFQLLAQSVEGTL